MNVGREQNRRVKCWMSRRTKSAKKCIGQTNPPRRKPKATIELGRVLRLLADGSERERKCGMRISACDELSRVDCGLNAQSRERERPVTTQSRRAGVCLRTGSLCVYSEIGCRDRGWRQVLSVSRLSRGLQATDPPRRVVGDPRTVRTLKGPASRTSKRLGWMPRLRSAVMFCRCSFRFVDIHPNSV